MKVHLSVLYSVVVVLLVLQIVSFVSVNSQVSKIISNQEGLEKSVEGYVSDLDKKIDSVRQDNQFGINELSKEVSQQKQDIETEIELLRSTQGDDFSEVIKNVVESVVNVRTDKSGGSGFIVDSRGYVITNLHVIQGGTFVLIQTFDGREYEASFIGADEFTDLALLKIDGFFDHIDFANSDEIEIGEKVIAIGNPLGLSFTVTEGIVSATDRAGPTGLEAYVQTDVTLNPGNSGGPLINKEGELIGINNFKIGGAESLGFALESNIVKEVVNNIAEQDLVG
jgi:S1-C subfamily serine protease